MRTIVIAATGHRPTKLFAHNPYSKENFESLVVFAKASMAKVLRQYNIQEAVVGGALGWDQAVAQACIDMHIPFVVAVPCKDQEKAWKSQAAQSLYMYQLSCAKEVIMVSDQPYDNTCMQNRNEYMVNRASHVLALFDGTKGGTGNCVEYAEKKDIQVINVWDEYSLYRGLITSFSGAFDFLSNFYPIDINIGSYSFSSSEAAYQASKCADKGDMHLFENLTSSQSKKLGKKVVLNPGPGQYLMRPDFHQVKVQIMLFLLRKKFQDPVLRQQLLATLQCELVEGNWWGDVFWGVCEGRGANTLGRLLMKVRDEIRLEGGA